MHARIPICIIIRTRTYQTVELADYLSFTYHYHPDTTYTGWTFIGCFEIDGSKIFHRMNIKKKIKD